MAWPQAPQPAPAPSAPAGGGTAIPIGLILTDVGAFLTLVFSLVQIMKVEDEFRDAGWSVWTTDGGFFGIGTWIPIFAVVAAAAALARTFVKGMDDKQVLGFGLLQVQVVAVTFAVLLWLGYVVNAVVADFVSPALGALLLFLSLALMVAGTGLSVLDARKGTTTTISASTGPPSGQWGAPTGPQPHSVPPAGQPGHPGAQPGSWPQPTPPPPPGASAPAGQWAPPPAPGQWQPDPTGAPGGPAAPPPPPHQQTQAWGQAPGPEQAWQPPAGSTPGEPAPAPQPPSPSPEPGPLDPQPMPPVDPGGPAGGGALLDPGTEVIPGPPPAPPRDDPGHVGGGPDAQPPIPPSNTP